MLTLFHAPQSRSTRIVWLLEELEVDYDLTQVSIRYGDGSGEGPDAANPHPDGKVPALLDGEALITESAAVALYLCDRFPNAGLGRAIDDPGRGRLLTWLAWAECEFGPTMFGATYGAPVSPGAIDAVFQRLEEALAQGDYLMGDRFGAADVMVGSGLMWMRDVMPASGTIDAYVARLSARPALQRAFAKDGERPG